jgi:hypothetical protein
VFRFVSWLLVIDSRKFLGGIISIFVALTSPFLLVESSFLCWHLLFWQVKFGQTLIFTDSRHMIKWWKMYIYICIYICIHIHTSYWSNYQAVFTRVADHDSSGIHRKPEHEIIPGAGGLEEGTGRNGTEMGPPWLCFYS